MKRPVTSPIDVLMCVGPRDVQYLLPYSIEALVKKVPFLKCLTIVTCARKEVLRVLKQHRLDLLLPSLKVLEDSEVVPANLEDWPGWCKQQFIKLHADMICETPVVACLGADTIVFKELSITDLFVGPTPILFYNRYPAGDKHLIYEQERVRNVARILRVMPRRSLVLSDFIMDFMLFASLRLRQLRTYLHELHGADAFRQILPREADTLEQRVTFGEWTLYAVFLLDVLNLDVPIRNSRNHFIAQVHSARDFADFKFDAHIVHFVDKSFDTNRILAAFNAAGDRQ